MKSDFDTVGGSIKTISFPKFVSLLGIVNTKEEMFPFNTLLSYGIDSSRFSEPDNEEGEVSTYKRLMAYPGESDPVKAALMCLGMQGGHIFAFRDKPITLLENAIVDSCTEYGQPQYAVRLCPRTWIVVDLEDFALIQNNNGFALACYAQNRTKIVQVLRLTEKEVLDNFNSSYKV